MQYGMEKILVSGIKFTECSRGIGVESELHEINNEKNFKIAVGGLRAPLLIHFRYYSIESN